MLKRYKVTYFLDDCCSAKANLIWQRYLISGFRTHPAIQFIIKPTIYHLPATLAIRGFRRNGLGWLSNAQHKRYGSNFSSKVGRYVILDRETNSSYHVAVDGSDGRAVKDPNALKWCDIYFKHNHWPSMSYPQQHKIRPLMNGDGYLNPRLFTFLSELRKAEKLLDFIYLTRIWKGDAHYTPEQCDNIVEHQVRLYETLSQLQCNKYLGVTLTDGRFKGAEKERLVKRLAAVGVSCQPHRLSQKEFWNLHGASKVVFARPGDHLCVSFRISVFLMMGASIAYDAEPFVQWCEPLVPGLHYVHGDCGLDKNYGLPDPSSYKGIIDAVETLLANSEKRDRLSRNAAQYYDTYSNPLALAQYVTCCCVSAPMVSEAYRHCG